MQYSNNDGFIDAVAETIATKIKERLDISSHSESGQPLRGAKYMTVKEVCELLHISKATLYRHRDTGFLKPSTYVGRKPLFTQNDINNYLNNFN